MATRKNVSRRTDRNRIRQLYSSGHSIEQISAAVSITEEHVAWLIKHMGMEKPVTQRDYDLQAMRAQIKQEIMAELRPAPAADPEDPLEKLIQQDQADLAAMTEMAEAEEAKEQVQTPDDDVVEEEEEAKPRRRRRAAAG